jgi:hypothetical protein
MPAPVITTTYSAKRDIFPPGYFAVDTAKPDSQYAEFKRSLQI